MTSTLRGKGGGKRGGVGGGGGLMQKMRCYRTYGGRGLPSALDVQSLFFFIKENWICAMRRHHAEPNINTLLTRNLPFDSDIRQ